MNHSPIHTFIHTLVYTHTRGEDTTTVCTCRRHDLKCKPCRYKTTNSTICSTVAPIQVWTFLNRVVGFILNKLHHLNKLLFEHWPITVTLHFLGRIHMFAINADVCFWRGRKVWNGVLWWMWSQTDTGEVGPILWAKLSQGLLSAQFSGALFPWQCPDNK